MKYRVQSSCNFHVLSNTKCTDFDQIMTYVALTTLVFMSLFAHIQKHNNKGTKLIFGAKMLNIRAAKLKGFTV